MSNNYIKKLKPTYKDYLWGGVKLKEKYNKKSDLQIIAESWEVSTHKDGESYVDDIKLSEYIKKNPNIINKHKELPVLIKLIDAKQDLSIQVHPDDTYANKYENDNGKTEMWYIVEAEENVFLYAGVNDDYTKEEIINSVKDNTLLDKLNKVPVKKGDKLFIKPGTIHAIGKGIVIYEIQQRSNVTYRLYDFNRKDANGNYRELHLEKSYDVINTSKDIIDLKPQKEFEDKKLLTECEYFKTYAYTSNNTVKIQNEGMAFLTVLNGEGTVNGENQVNVKKGDTVLIPNNVDIEFIGNAEFIYSIIV